MALRRAGAAIDVIGQIGTDPGDAWSSAGVSTLDGTMRRRADVTTGDPDGFDAFDPSAGWEGFPIDTFEGLGLHEAGETTPNAAPMALVDNAAADSSPVRIDVLANDSDPDGDELTVVEVTSPSAGSASIVEGGAAVVYTPATSAWTADSFRYTVSDPHGSTASARVEIRFAGPPQQETPCQVTPTIVGSDGSDVLVGTTGVDVIHAGAGRDIVLALGGDDLVCGGPGFDIVFGGTGDDSIYDDAGPAWVIGGPGDDRIVTGAAPDRIWGGGGDDVIASGAGNDRLRGGDGDDSIDGGPGRDFLDGGRGSDDCAGEPGERVVRCP